jgi:cytoskeletal protein RodZ
VTDKSAAVLPATPRNHIPSQKGGSTAPGIAPADFGRRLLRGREQKNRSLSEIADTTKIAVHQLRSLERGDLHRLPGGIYRRAIVRQYAAAVGLNVEDTLRDLASVGGEPDGPDQTVEAVAVPRGDAGSSPFSTALWSSAAALVVLGAVAAAATAWYRGGAMARATDVPVTASAPVETDAPAIESVAATDAVRAATETVGANVGAIELATQPAAVPTQTGGVVDGEPTEGELLITSEPVGAQVTVNGISWGATPVTIRYMPFGKKLIRATKPGYVSAQRGFDFVPDRRARSVRIQLSAESPDSRETVIR